MRLEYFRFLTVGCLFVAGCASPAADRLTSSFDTLAETYPIDPSFKIGLGILSGFDPPHVDGNWQADDRVLLGVKVEHGGADDVWFVRVSTLPRK